MSQVSESLFYNSLNGEGTDCTFNFKHSFPIHAHRCVLSSVSPVFEANFKATWKGDKPIEVNSTTYEVFKALMEAIYLGEVELFPDLKFILEFYKAAHFYQLDEVLKLARDTIIDYCKTMCPLSISALILTSLEYKDYYLMEYLRKYFIERAFVLIESDDFLNYPLEVINAWYQIDELNVTEENLLKYLDLYVKKRGLKLISLLKPAIESLRLKELPAEKIFETILLSEKQRKEIKRPRKLDGRSVTKSKREYSSQRCEIP